MVNVVCHCVSIGDNLHLFASHLSTKNCICFDQLLENISELLETGSCRFINLCIVSVFSGIGIIGLFIE